MIGKFNSAEELLKSYNELEKSFTQKCQQLKELQKQNAQQQSGTSENSPPQATGNSIDSVPPEKEAADVQSDNVPYEENGAAAEVQVDCAVPANNDALFAANDGRAPRQTPALPKVMINGGNVSMALPSKPKTLKEASVLAKKIFEN